MDRTDGTCSGVQECVPNRDVIRICKNMATRKERLSKGVSTLLIEIGLTVF